MLQLCSIAFRYYLTGSDAIRLKLRVKSQAMPVEVMGGDKQQQPQQRDQSALQAEVEATEAHADAEDAAETLQQLSFQDVEAAVAASLTVSQPGSSSHPAKKL